MSKFTTILHSQRKEAEMSMNEYVLTDTIHHLSRNRWCNMSRETMANEFGLTKPGIIKIIDRLVESGWIEKSPEGNLKTTDKWEILIYDSGKQSIPQSVNKVIRIGKQSIPNIYIDNNIISTIEETKVSNEDEESILDVPNKRIVRASSSDINFILSAIKDNLSTHGYSYSNNKERLWATNLLRNAEWKKLVEESGGDYVGLVRNIMEYANTDVFWIGKITSAMSFYYKFAILSNQMKTKGLFKRNNAKEDNDRKLAAINFFNNL